MFFVFVLFVCLFVLFSFFFYSMTLFKTRRVFFLFVCFLFVFSMFDFCFQCRPTLFVFCGVPLQLATQGPFTNTCYGGPDAKRGPLKFLALGGAGPEKNTVNFPVKIASTCFSMGLTHNFHGQKKGGLYIFSGLKGGPEKFS